MANTFITPSVIAKTTLGLLTREIVLPSVVWRDFESEFAGRIGDSVTVRVPATATAREWTLDNNRSSPVVSDDLTESSFTVSLDKIAYHVAKITDEDFDLRIENFGSQILLPQVRAIAEAIENYVAATMQGATYATELEVNTTDPYLTLVSARKALNDANVPRADRFAVVGSEVEESILTSDRNKPLDNTVGVGAYGEATIGRVAGFTVLGSNALDPGEAYCFHRSAYILSTRAPVVPQGSKQGASESYAGLAATWTQDYDPDYFHDRSAVRAFVGTQAVLNSSDEVDRAVRLEIVTSS